MVTSHSHRSHHSSREQNQSHSRRETVAEKEKRLQQILDRKKALDLQQEELDKQYMELNDAGNDLLSQRDSVSRSKTYRRRDDRSPRRYRDDGPVQSKPIYTKDLRKRARSPSRREGGTNSRRTRERSHTGESSPRRIVDQNPTPNKSRASPFIRDLANAKINRTNKVPSNLEMYDGTGDPHDHTFTFEQAMLFHGHDEAAMCHLFLSTLKKTSREWIVSLPSASIRSWDDLKEQFHTRFGSNKRRAKMIMSLIQVKQRPNETLRPYIKRFREAVSEVSDIDPKQVIHFLTMGLHVDKSSRLIEEIISKAPESLPEAYEKVDKFVELEEALANLRGTSKYTGDFHQRDPRGEDADKKYHNYKGNGKKDSHDNWQRKNDGSKDRGRRDNDTEECYQEMVSSSTSLTE